MKCPALCFLIYCTIFLRPINSKELKKPTVLIGVLVRNKAHVLPYTLSYLEKLNYPKDRIAIWFRSDNNIDNSIEILKIWISVEGGQYFSINTSLDKKSSGHEDEKGYSDWSTQRFLHVIKLREEILNYGRKIWADYIFMLDADVFLMNPNVLNSLIEKNKTVVAPLLRSDGMYSNFWAGMTSDFYYLRTEDYEPILSRRMIGCFSVPMVHSAFLINMNAIESDFLTYESQYLRNYNGPVDDIITFALGANSSNISLNICNDQVYGFVMIPLESNDTIRNDLQQLVNTKLEILNMENQNSIQLLDYLKRFVTLPEKDNAGVDQIYLINLLRRPERRQRMVECFDHLGINAKIIDAVDGKTLDENVLKSWDIKLMVEYEDPYKLRPMKMGEVGCFLSHHYVWSKIIEDGHETAMVLEDDVKFEPFFKSKLKFLLNELARLKIDWDLVYLGRKSLKRESESYVEGSKYLAHPGYSYWTIGYLISAKGAKKLVDSKVLNHLLPVDEFLPIMFDKHPRTEWTKYFPKRNLKALSAEPYLIYPTHYTNDSGYISDTENSIQLTQDFPINHGDEL